MKTSFSADNVDPLEVWRVGQSYCIAKPLCFMLVGLNFTVLTTKHKILSV